MHVGVFSVFRKDPEPYIIGEMLVRSIREAMPGVPVVHFTDETSPGFPWADQVRRKANGKLLERRLEHYALAEGPWLFLDTDVIVNKDVRHVFNRAYDVALVDRHWPHLPETPELTVRMPYNTGVVFSQSPEFWRSVLETWRSYPPNEQASWLSEQRAVAHVAKTGPFWVQVLDGSKYNYPPKDASDPYQFTAPIVHYKGSHHDKAHSRKWWMRQRGMAQMQVQAA